MRLTAAWAWISVGLLAVACGDEDPAPVVNHDIAWVVGCEKGTCGSGLTRHSMEADPKTPYQVSCSRNGSFFNFTVRDPGVTEEEAGLDPDRDARYGSELTVRNIEASTGGCNVDVREQAPGDQVPISYRAPCGSGCTITVLGAEGNWDFIAELLCDGLRPSGNTAEANPHYSLSHVESKQRPVLVKLANCD